MSQADKLRALEDLRNPALRVTRFLTERANADAVSKLELTKGEKGDTGETGPQGPQGPRGPQGLQGEQGASGRDGRDGRDGIDGTNGKDGKNGRDGVSPSIKSVVDELRAQPVSYSDLKDAPDLTDLPKLIEFLKRGGFRGGGGGTGTVAIVYTETPTGLINGSNKTYTTAHTISNVYSFAINGQFLHPTSDYSVSGTTITMATALDASLSGLPFTITYS